MSDVDKDFCYITMMISNTTTLEGKFSVKRQTNLDTASKYAIGNTNECVKMSVAALKRSSYNSDDIKDEKDAWTVGSSFFSEQMRNVDQSVQRWKLKWKDRLQIKIYSERFDSKNLPTKEPEKNLFYVMNQTSLEYNYLTNVLLNNSFQRWMRLTIGSNNEQWFDELILVENEIFTTICHNIMHLLFGYLVQYTIHRDPKDITFFEYKVNEYISGSEFNNLYKFQLPPRIRGNRMGAIILLKTLAEILEKWVVDAMSKISFSQNEKVATTKITTLSDKEINELIHRLLGAAMRKCTSIFRSIKQARTRHFSKYYHIDDASGASAIINLITLDSHMQAASDIDYIQNFYPASIQMLNQGGLLSLKKELFPWGKMVTEKIYYTVTKKEIHRLRKTALQHFRNELMLDGYNNLLNSFWNSIIGIRDLFDTNFDEWQEYKLEKITLSAAKALHYELVSYFLEAYTSDIFKQVFSKQNNKSGDLSKTTHRVHMQVVGSSVKQEGCKNSKGNKKAKTKDNKISKKEISKEKKKKIMITEYDGSIIKALEMLNGKNNDANKLRSKIACASILYCCYKVFHDYKSSKLDALKEHLIQAISNNADLLKKTTETKTLKPRHLDKEDFQHEVVNEIWNENEVDANLSVDDKEGYYDNKDRDISHGGISYL